MKALDEVKAVVGEVAVAQDGFITKLSFTAGDHACSETVLLNETQELPEAANENLVWNRLETGALVTLLNVALPSE